MKDDRKAKQIALNLNKSFFAHGDAVSRSRARNLELQVAPDDPELEKLLWEAYLGLESHMSLREPFNPLGVFLSSPAAAATLAPAGPVALPANTPSQVAQQVWQAVANQALQAASQAAPQVPYSVVNAVIESSRLASEFRTTGNISAARQPGGEIRISMVDTAALWTPVQVGTS
jgi:hypothetical protein